jgi:hypothetical protein
MTHVVRTLRTSYQAKASATNIFLCIMFRTL